MKNRQIVWINCAKAVAIIAVMLDHVYGMLYTDSRLQRMTHFAVPLFILLSGITSYMTAEKYADKGWIRTFFHKIKTLFFAYLVASVIYSIVMNGIDLKVLLLSLIHFNASGPLYYVALYIQLMFLFWPFYQILKRIPINKKGILYETVIGTTILLFSIWTTNYTNVLSIAGGGGKLFGGTFLFLFYLGMIMEKHRIFHADSGKKIGLVLSVSAPLTVLFECLVFSKQEVIDRFSPVQGGTNPPGLILMCTSIVLLFFCYALFSLLDKGVLKKPIDVIGRLGQHTLFLFLYHKLFLDMANHFLRTIVPLVGRWMIYFAVMLAGPLFVEWVFHIIRNRIKILVDMGDHSVGQK